MAKDTNINIRVDSDIKRQAEQVMSQFGLNMTTTVNMLLRQIVREQAIPLSLSMDSSYSVYSDLLSAQTERASGYNGRLADDIIGDMRRIVSEVENGTR